MGWLWGSKPDDTPTDASAREGAPNTSMPEASKRDFGLTEEQRLRIFGKPGPDSPNTTSTPANREEQADAELNAFLATLDNSDTTTTTSPSNQQQEPTPNATAATPTHDPSSIHPGALYPRTLSCRQLFDQAFYCQSLGGKFNDIYRYGQLQSCSEHWSAFWFCMRIRTLESAERERQVVDFYRERDQRRREEWGSSEDVWGLRERRVGKAFWRDPDAEEGGEREWTVGRGEEK